MAAFSLDLALVQTLVQTLVQAFSAWTLINRLPANCLFTRQRSLKYSPLSGPGSFSGDTLFTRQRSLKYSPRSGPNLLAHDTYQLSMLHTTRTSLACCTRHVPATRRFTPACRRHVQAQHALLGASPPWVRTLAPCFTSKPKSSFKTKTEIKF